MEKIEERPPVGGEWDLGIEEIKTPWACAKPALLFAITTLSIFVGEGMVMLVLPHLPDMGVIETALVDASLLTLIVIPMLYLFLFRPMHIHVNERKKIEDRQKKLIGDLRDAMEKVKILSGLLPICASCKKIRDEKGAWNSLERYISERSDAEFTHSICPECEERLYPEMSEKKAR